MNGTARPALPTGPISPGSQRTWEVVSRRSASGGGQRSCRDGRAISAHSQAHACAPAIPLQAQSCRVSCDRQECNLLASWLTALRRTRLQLTELVSHGAMPRHHPIDSS